MGADVKPDAGIADDGHRLAAGMRLVVASHNKGKVWEINQLIAPFGLEAVSAGALGLAEPEETETSFIGNARLKAVAAASASGLPALADDSGLEVEALGGAPGIFSARWAGPAKDFAVAMRKVAEEITQRDGWSAPGPRANFTSAICLAWPDGTSREFEGKVHGHLVWPPRGGNGFGYDPMFVADGEALTFGEMQPAEKYAISHRTRAFAAFKDTMLADVPMVSVSSTSQNESRDALVAAAANLSTREELVRFIANLGAALAAETSARLSFGDGLGRIQAALDSARLEASHADALEADPKWRLIAKLLLAASGRG
ncbi:MAG: RdgB/HAM1 family non-canonical purine NTP pyrophosphatase [Hyphomicrobiaceae bacterium]|nr:RdgB/HAM1 family non-canonical purine NTP pyrophosphatase [Hyphomicrobiaceae bacterium]